jgi:four helix bundle protein
LGSNTETETWIEFAKECEYIKDEDYKYVLAEVDQIGKMLTKLHQNWKSYGK